MAKKSYPAIIIRVPNTINYDTVFSLIPDHTKDLTQYQIKKLQESLYLFLSYLYPSKSRKNKKWLKNQWKTISMTEFRKINRNFEKVVVNILTDNRYPVIDVDIFYVPKYKSREYRLKKEFQNRCKPIEITIESVISQNYLKNVTPKPILESNSSYDYLLNNYDKSIITIDSKVYAYISALEAALKKRLISRKKEVQEFYNKKIDAKITKLKNHVKNIEDGKFNAIVKKRNRRLYSEFCYCNKELRKFILINNSKVSEVDINACHLYALASILNKEFFISTEKPFSLKNINDDYFIRFNNSFKQSKYYAATVIDLMYQNKTKKEEDKSYVDKFKNSLLLYMMKHIENSTIDEFKALPFDNGLYENLDDILELQKGKNYVKKNVMLFLNMVHHRSKNLFVTKMDKEFPPVCNVINILNSLNKNKLNLAVMLQCVESYLLLEVGIMHLLDRIPNLKFITIHDAIIVEEQYAQEVRDLLAEVITHETGIPIGISITEPQNPIDEIEIIADKAANTIKKKCRCRKRETRKEFEINSGNLIKN